MSNNSPITSSYLNYLPAIFQQDLFIGRFLLACEAILGDLSADTWQALGAEEARPGLETMIGKIHTYFNPETTDADFLPWLASWVGLSLRADWAEETQRDFIREIVPLYKKRGTKAGLERMLAIYTRESVTIYDDFTDPPHYFQVELTLSEPDADKLRRKQEIARAIIEQEKPAHTFYALQIAVPTMQLPARLGTEETLLGTKTAG